MAAPEIPKKQKAAIYDQPGSVSTKVVELDVPEPGSGEVLINLYVISRGPRTGRMPELTITEPILGFATLTLAS